MANTAICRIYHVRSDADLQVVSNRLQLENNYSSLQFREEIQQQQGVEIQAFTKSKSNIPDWYKLVSSYIKPPHSINFLSHDFIAFIKDSSADLPSQTYAICGGSGQCCIDNIIDHSFGITVLEAVFEPKKNKISSEADIQIIGDVLASRRFYRSARSVAYEDNFGKTYQSIISRFRFLQIKEKFPQLSTRLKNKTKSKISISGSSSVEVRTKIDFMSLILLLKDLTNILSREYVPIFNTSLIPLDNKTENGRVDVLNGLVYEDIVKYCFKPAITTLDFVFCYRDFESFFGSSVCQFEIRGITATNKIDTIKYDDVYDLHDSRFIKDIFDLVKPTKDYHDAEDKEERLKEIFKNSIVVKTLDEEGNQTTSGKLIEYIQYEISEDGQSYFFIDGRWYQLQKEFDKKLAEKYVARVASKLFEHEFILNWDRGEETDYNAQYNNPPDSLFLHPIKVDQIELCDVLIIDRKNKAIYIIHVKDDIGASIRDLTSQAFISARIIEEEVRTQDKDKLNKLYTAAFEQGRIDGSLSRDEFIKAIVTFKRQYVLAVRANGKSMADLKSGAFNSRIAKFSLIEFAGVMQANDWDFAICPIKT